MRVFNETDTSELAAILRGGGVVVLRTDTLYGIVARADNKSSVERVYTIKGRDANKSCVILLDSPASSYGSTKILAAHIASYGDKPTSFLIESKTAPEWLLRENDFLAYRVPELVWLEELIAQTGPLIAPSANPQAQLPARTVQQAMEYFGNKVDGYVDGGEVPADMPPSRLLKIDAGGHIERLR